jgi:diguanylate cyclase (GGDEF)-like protein/PAS domain S-box-containing protein
MQKLIHKRIGIAPLLSASSAILALALTLIVVQLIDSFATDQVETDIRQGLAELAFQTTDQLDRGMYERYREVQLMADRFEIRDASIPKDAKRALLHSMQETYPYYAWIGLTDRDGKVLVATKGMLEGFDVSKRPWFSRAYEGKYLTDVHEALLLEKLMPYRSAEPSRFFDIAFPYRDKEGKIAGVLGTHLSLQWARDAEESVLQPLNKRRGVRTFILSSSGDVLLGPKEYRGKNFDVASRQLQVGSSEEQWLDGKRYVVGYSHSRGFRSYPGLGWTVLVTQDIEQAYAPVYKLKRRVLCGGTTAALLASILLWLLAKRVTSPLRTIAGYANEVRLGHARQIPSVSSRLREVGVLEGALRALLDDISQKEERLREVNAGLEHAVEERTADLHSALAEVRGSEQRVRSIIDTALDAFVELDDAGRITGWNPQACTMFGYQREEILGQAMIGSIVPVQSGEGSAGLHGVSLSGAASMAGKRQQSTGLRRDGTEFPVEISVGLINRGDRHFFGVFIQDISDRKRIEADLANERELLDVVLDSIDVGVVVCSVTGEILLLNRAARELHGLPAENVPVNEWARHYDLFGADGTTLLAPEQIPLFRALQGETVRNVEMTVVPQGKAPHFLFASGRALFGGAGEKIGAVIAMKDVTDLKRSEQRIENSERLLRTITDNVPVLIAYIDKDEVYRFANATYEEWFGVPRSSIVGRTVKDAWGGQISGAEADFVRRCLAGETVRFQSEFNNGGAIRFVEVTGIPDIKEGVTEGVYVLSTDITARRMHEEELNRLARVDSLTSLSNRRSYEERLEESIKRARRSGLGLALFFLDIDHFKRINDTLGHAAGDAVLSEFARRLQESVRATDVACRLAGDEFTIIAEGLRSPAEAELIARKVLGAFASPVAAGDQLIQVGTSIGIAFSAGGASDAKLLNEQADSALYVSKAAGRGRYSLF